MKSWKYTFSPKIINTDQLCDLTKHLFTSFSKLYALTLQRIQKHESHDTALNNCSQTMIDVCRIKCKAGLVVRPVSSFTLYGTPREDAVISPYRIVTWWMSLYVQYQRKPWLNTNYPYFILHCCPTNAMKTRLLYLAINKLNSVACSNQNHFRYASWHCY